MDACFEIVVFSFALAVGMMPLTGTTSRAHMEEDLPSLHVQLTPSEVAMIEGLVRQS